MKNVLPLLFTICLYSLSNTIIAGDDNSTAVNEYDLIIQKEQNVIIGIQNCLYTLANFISSGQINTIKNPAATNANIQNIIQATNHLLAYKFIEINANHVYEIIMINRSLLQHIDNWVKECTSFNAWAFNPEKEKAHLRTPRDYKDLVKLSLNNEKALLKLTEKINIAGLKWYNHAYRLFDNYIINPIIKNNIISRITGIGSITFASLYVWWHLDQKSFCANRYIPHIIKKKIFGDHPTLFNNSPGSTTTPIIPSHNQELGIIPKIEQFSYIMTITGAGSIFYGSLKNYSFNFMSEEIKRYIPNISNWIQQKHNRMLGGAFIKYANSLDKTYTDNTKFCDLIGMEQVKKQFKLLIDYIKNPEPYDRKGLTPHKGYLLYGASRTGKSFAVKALINEIKEATNNSQFTFQEVTVAEINQLGIKAINTVMKDFAPCIIFIDEIDLIGLGRDGKNQTLSDFLVTMSGTAESKDPRNQVIIIGATNRPETLDHALRQPGRFGMRLFCRLPGIDERKAAIINELHQRALDINIFDINKLAAETEGQSYQSIAYLINKGLLTAQLQREAFSQKHLEQTINEDIREIMFEFKPLMSTAQEQILSTHFAGIALTLTLLNLPLTVASVTTHPVKKALKDDFIWSHMDKKDLDNQERYHEHGKIFTSRTTDSIDIATYQERLAYCTYLMGGVAAEELLYGMPSYSCGASNVEQALNIAFKLVSQGLDIKKLPDTTQKELYGQAMIILQNSKDQAKKLLSENRELLCTIASELRKKKVLNGNEINSIIRAHNNNANATNDEKNHIITENTIAIA